MQVLKEDIHLPESMNMEVSAVPDYPPRLLITARISQSFISPKIYVEGLNRECGFNLLIPFHSETYLKQRETAIIH
jgi:hypothetical protein